MDIGFVTRDKNRVPALKLGSGLLRPVPESVRAIAVVVHEEQCVRALQHAVAMGRIDFDTGYFRTEEKPVTVVTRGRAPSSQWGGNAANKKFESERTRLENADYFCQKIYGRRDNCWKSHRNHQYR